MSSSSSSSSAVPVSSAAGGAAGLTPATQPRISRWVGAFLRAVLMPLIVFGIPAWPVLGVLCAVPVIGIVTIPLFLLLTVLLLYAIAWFSYLVLAQADPPSSSQSGYLGGYLPFLPFSPVRCLKINWATLLYATAAAKVALPAVFDWCYRRVMVLGTQGGGGIVRENILYGSPYPNRRLDVYVPPLRDSGLPTSSSSTASLHNLSKSRHRKHSTLFAEPSSSDFVHALDADPSLGVGGGRGTRSAPGAPALPKAPVIVFVPSPIPPLGWTKKRKTYLQLALRLRRQGYCVFVPDITWYPEARVKASVIDLRLVLRWVADNCARYGGDVNRIHVMGHGMSAHLIMLTLTQEAVVLSREGHLEREYERQEESLNATMMQQQPQQPSHYYRHQHQYSNSGGDPTETGNKERGEAELATGEQAAQQRRRLAASAAARSMAKPTVDESVDDNAWVDEAVDEASVGDLPPGAVMSGVSNPEARLASQLGHEGPVPFPTAATAAAGAASQPSSGDGRHPNGTSSNAAAAAAARLGQAGPSTAISNGLRRVEIYEAHVELPPIAGVILLAGVFDVIKCFRGESDRGVEHLSSLRRSCGPSHTSCLLHSPAHLLYAAKNLLDTSLLPPKFLLIHGGKDAVVDISQSTLLKTLLSGVGVEQVKLRAYRELGHAEAVASLFVGMGKASTRYSRQIMTDISDFVTL
ncbi:alpha/beta-hydrolase [Acaromyces ingoldii]|uniref:Alpha/beta-hydrolase n=1 Tax=Acaromyces ingoldii TaxID=215250 RepID=A0A316YV81_9BASI|nr:alpha/beta-hydrolase [Acaromyces ingoldii]PWN92966.1 alpha/beta-hydrolase [Acaromyces ingoldii]